MNTDQVKEMVVELISDALATKGKKLETFDGETVLLGGPLDIDSLDLAGIVVNLTERCKSDPFAEGFIEFRTVNELVQLYSDNR